MCWAEKCCYFIPANLGCILLGVTTFVLSTCLMAASIIFYIYEPDAERVGPLTSEQHHVVVLGLQLKMSSLYMILVIVIIFALFWMLFSILLLVGLIKKKPSMVLAYFAFSIIITILIQLTALLLLIHNCWILATVLFISSMIHIHCLVVVHTVYDFMQRGKDFTLHLHRDDDQDPLADCFDQDTERI